MAVSAKDVMELRRQTDCGMMECKKALVKADGDINKAIEILREEGLATAAKKAGRIAAEGMVYAVATANGAVVVEVNAETDFVAKNDKFVEFTKDLANVVAEQKPADVEALMGCKMGEGTVDEALKALILVIKENSKDIAMQIAAANPSYLNREAVPAEAIENEKKIIIAQMANDPKAANKPDAIKEKMATGRLGKFYKENCLVDQAFIKDGNMDVNAYVNATAKKLGGDIKIVEYTHFIKGEGLEKRVDDFAAEVAAAVKG